MPLVREIRAPDLRVREWVVGRSERLRVSERPQVTLFLLKSGRATAALGRETHPVRRLTVVTVGPGTRAELEVCEARASLVECLLEPTHLAPGDVLLPSHGMAGSFGVFRSAKPAWKDFLELLVPGPDTEAGTPPAVVQGGLFTALERVRRKERRRGRPQAEWLEVARARLAAEYRSPPLVLELAREAGVERRRFVRLFRQRYGVTPSDYLREVRVRRATELMRNSSQSLRAIALQCGFHHRQHLERSVRLAAAGGDLDPAVRSRLGGSPRRRGSRTSSSRESTSSHPRAAGRHVAVSGQGKGRSF